MSRSRTSHQFYSEHVEVTPRPAMVMPRLSHAQMLAILRESGVPENEARRWIEHDRTIAAESSTSDD